MQVIDQTKIKASSETVWRVSTDVENWPDWNPVFESVKRLDDGNFREGSTACIKQKAMPETVWTVTDLVEFQSFTWQTKVRGIKMIATHEIIQNENSVTNHLKLEVQGLLGKILWPFMKSQIQKALQNENRLLKQRCEV